MDIDCAGCGWWCEEEDVFVNGKYGWIDDDDDDLRPERPLRIWMNDMKKRSTEQTKTTYRLRPSKHFSFVFPFFFSFDLFMCGISTSQHSFDPPFIFCKLLYL